MQPTNNNIFNINGPSSLPAQQETFNLDETAVLAREFFASRMQTAIHESLTTQLQGQGRGPAAADLRPKRRQGDQGSVAAAQAVADPRPKRQRMEVAEPEAIDVMEDSGGEEEFQQAVATFQNIMHQQSTSCNDPTAAAYFHNWYLLDTGALQSNEDIGRSLKSCLTANDVLALMNWRGKKIRSLQARLSSSNVDQVARTLRPVVAAPVVAAVPGLAAAPVVAAAPVAAGPFPIERQELAQAINNVTHQIAVIEEMRARNQEAMQRTTMQYNQDIQTIEAHIAGMLNLFEKNLQGAIQASRPA